MDDKEKYVVGYGINYSGYLPKVPKAPDFLRPIYEAFTNALEALSIAQKQKIPTDRSIYIDLIMSEQQLVPDKDKQFTFEKIIITDSGIGFSDSEYERFINLNDTGKGYSNRGTGRIQYLHFFNTTEVTSTFADSSASTGWRYRSLTLSKQKAFLKKNAIVLLKEDKEVKASESKTVVIFREPLSTDDRRKYEDLGANDLKTHLLEHYLGYFCENRSELPSIEIRLIYKVCEKKEGKSEMVSKLIQTESITKDDIPDKHETLDIEMPYQRYNFEDGCYEASPRKETMTIKGFRVQQDKLPENRIRVTSKGQITHTKVNLDSLTTKDTIDGQRYLFLLSSKYFDSKDSDVRGKLKIPRKSEVKPSSETQKDFYEQAETEWIFFEDIQAEANAQITRMYKEILTKAEEKKKDIEELKKMFLLKDESLDGINVAITDTDADVLEKIYQSEAKKRAKLDAELKRRIDSLESMDTTDPDYPAHLEKEVDELTAQIPLQNKNEISQYIARRKLVLKLFEKIINRQTHMQNLSDENTSERDKTEALLHNLIFRQNSTDPSLSDLWLINEEFIYFKGSSEIPLGKTKLNGKRLFKKKLTELEQDYFENGNGVKTKKRPDVLLFPEEGKCIILEFKALDVDVSDYLAQVKKYASWILNYAEDGFQITKFYAYIIGENVNVQDVIAADSYFENAAKFDYVFNPHTPIKDLEGNTKGSLYMEALKYSSLLERAKLRNKIFIDKLGLNLD